METFSKLALAGLLALTTNIAISAEKTTLPDIQDQAFRLEQPRINPLSETEWSPEVGQILNSLRQNGEVLNILATVAQHPELLKSWLGFGQHILGTSTLPARDREFIILRIGWLNNARYEWGHHVPIGKAAGLSDADIERISQGPDSPGLSVFEKTLLSAVDELDKDSFIQTETWNQLAQHYNKQQMLDLLFTAGQYRMVSMMLNSIGVQLEESF